jgi:hypothetical protein
MSNEGNKPMSGMDPQYLTCARTAKFVRQALKESFPGAKFYVNSHTYSGGASIRVRWVDGPSTMQVKKITARFAGSYFDGSIDYQGRNFHSMDGRPVLFGANFVFTDREYSDAAISIARRQVMRDLMEEEFLDMPGGVAAFKSGHLYNVPVGDGAGWDMHWNLQSQVNMLLAERSDRSNIHPSPTLSRVQFTGDDGYGQNTVGPNFTGGGLCHSSARK